MENGLEIIVCNELLSLAKIDNEIVTCLSVYSLVCLFGGL